MIVVLCVKNFTSNTCINTTMPKLLLWWRRLSCIRQGFLIAHLVSVQTPHCMLQCNRVTKTGHFSDSDECSIVDLTQLLSPLPKMRKLIDFLQPAVATQGKDCLIPYSDATLNLHMLNPTIFQRIMQQDLQDKHQVLVPVILNSVLSTGPTPSARSWGLYNTCISLLKLSMHAITVFHVQQ